MITKPLLLTLALITIGKVTNAQTFEWAKQLAGIFGNRGLSIAIDASGNVYTTGYFFGTVDFDPGAEIFNLTSAGDNDIFISKLDASGNFEWAKQLGGTSSDEGHSIAVDALGNVYTTGYFNETVDFDPGAAIFNLTSTGSFDIFIIKLNVSGNFEWAKQMGGRFSDKGNSIAVDASGNVYTTGRFDQTSDFDPGIDTFNLSSTGSSDIFISKLDALGNFVWAKQMGGTSIDEGSSISVDTLGNVYTTGYFNGTVDFDPGAGIFNLSSAGNNDIFITKLDAFGNFVWANRMGGTNSDLGLSIAIDASGNVYTTGYFFGTADFDPGAATFNLTSSGAHDIFIAKLDESGNFAWAKKIGGTFADIANSIAADTLGNVYITGNFAGTVDFDPGVGIYNLLSAGDEDIFILKLDALGHFVWAKQMGGTFGDRGLDIAVDATGNIYTTGAFSGTCDFDPGIDTFNLIAEGNADIFVHKMTQTTTGISNSTFDKEFIIYPNPTSGQFYISLDENISNTDVILRNCMGQEILRKSFKSTNIIEFKIDGKAGLYLLEIRGNDKHTVLKVLKY